MMDTDRAGIVFFCWFLFLLFAGTNPYLTFHCVSQGTILLDLAPDDKEYQSVEEEVFANKFNDPVAVYFSFHLQHRRTKAWNTHWKW